jgi:hypothetical protein
MVYALKELLVKMGIPETDLMERRHVEWHYFDTARIDLAGFAEVRMEEAGSRLVAELRHTKQDYEDDHGTMHDHFEQTFHMVAERVGEGVYEVKSMGFDGENHAAPARAICEMGLGLFHARMLDISIRMVERAFNKDDILDTLLPEAPVLRPLQKAIFAVEAPRKETFGKVIPFRQRAIA